MAGLTKAQRAERAAQNSVQAQAAQSAGELDKQAPTPKVGAKSKTVPMVRSEPMHARGPVSADVHPDEVENWKAAGWTVA